MRSAEPALEVTALSQVFVGCLEIPARLFAAAVNQKGIGNNELFVRVEETFQSPFKSLELDGAVANIATAPSSSLACRTGISSGTRATKSLNLTPCPTNIAAPNNLS